MDMIYVNILSNILQALKGPIKYEKLESCIKILAEIASTDSDLFVDGETPQLIPFFLVVENKTLIFVV